jgi:hypothetical protein
MMFNMGMKKRIELGEIATPEVPEYRSRFVGLRLSPDDADRLEALARAQGVGLSTLARLIIERYVADHGRKEK